MEARFVDTADALAACIAEVRDEPRYALDTEFHGERSYWPRLALIQLAWPRGVALIDPLAVDPAPLRTLLAGPGCMIAHAADHTEVLRSFSRLGDVRTRCAERG